MAFFSPDTDVLVLLVANFDRLPSDPSISLSSHLHDIQTIWDSLLEANSKALIGLHASTGADITGRFYCITKKWVKFFLEAGAEVHVALKKICNQDDFSEELLSSLATFFVQRLVPKS